MTLICTYIINIKNQIGYWLSVYIIMFKNTNPFKTCQFSMQYYEWILTPVFYYCFKKKTNLLLQQDNDHLKKKVEKFLIFNTEKD